MSDELIVKLAGQLPKGDLNGLADDMDAAEMYRKKIGHRYQPPRVALVILDVREAKAGKDGIDTLMFEVSRIEPVNTVAGRRLAERMLEDEYAARTGSAMPPFEVAQLSKNTFADLPRTVAEVDEREAREQDAMSADDELRMHLERVHGVPDARTLTAEGAAARHEADHRTEMFSAGPLAHEEGWIGWTRADLEQAEIEADDVPSRNGGETADPSLFDHGEMDAEDVGAVDPDPDYGRDLDDEDDR